MFVLIFIVLPYLLINAYITHVGNKANKEYAERQAEQARLRKEAEDWADSLTPTDRRNMAFNQIMWYQEKLDEKSVQLSALREEKKRYDTAYGGAGPLNKEIRELRKETITYDQALRGLKENYRNKYPEYYSWQFGYEYDDEDEEEEAY